MELWSLEHIKTLLPALLAMVVLSVVFRLILGKKSLNARMIPIQIIAVLLVLLEIGKQVTSFLRGYDLYHIPLHYCSLFLFTLPVMAFYKGKHRQTSLRCHCRCLRRAVYFNADLSCPDLRQLGYSELF